MTDLVAEPLRVLHVEDNPINATLFGLLVRREPGLLLRHVANAAAALELARDWQPQALVIDAHLPDLDGHQLLPRLRALPGLAEVPAFMYSADDEPAAQRRARDAGFEAHWSKPVAPGTALAALRDIAARVCVQPG